MTKWREAERPQRPQGRVCLVLAPILCIVALIVITEMITLLGPLGDHLVGLRQLAWPYRLPTLSPEETVPAPDLLHLSLLHEVCVNDVNASVSWQFGAPGHQLVGGTANNSHVLVHKDDTDLLPKLRHCPDVDIFLPHKSHTAGYCQDAAAYVKYLESRLLPEWVLDVQLDDPDLGRQVDYFSLCPRTPVLFLGHHWSSVAMTSRWPSDKPIYMMPNIEIMELTPLHFLRVDAVLCKTRVCYDRVTQWYKQVGNPRNASVFYTKHTSSSPSTLVRKRLGEYAVASKDYAEVKFTHLAGVSSVKGTREVLECWLHTSDLPLLDVYIDRKPFYRLFSPSFKSKVAHSLSPVNIRLGTHDHLTFSKVVAEALYMVSPSYGEGYGHTLNQARSSGAVIVTTDMSPMNELVTNETGVLIPVSRVKHPMVLMGGDYKGEQGLKDVEGLVASFEASDVCKAVQRMMQSTTVDERAKLGLNASRQYHADTKYFAKAMEKLRTFANP
uniref:Glycosyl transferase family 1 domain-containing protein n=1 Tax=Peronospora matthiolae TaxID=2874970 RepID=A0AAV1T875_9STRA